MTILAVPTFDDPFYTQTTIFEGVPYLLAFKYNQRENAWYFSIALQDATPIADGIKIICNRPLLKRVADVRKPPGEFIATSSTTDTSPPGASELGAGKRVQLHYFTKA